MKPRKGTYAEKLGIIGTNTEAERLHITDTFGHVGEVRELGKTNVSNVLAHPGVSLIGSLSTDGK